jgi:mono/diheme cytochrome c family protein
MKKIVTNTLKWMLVMALPALMACDRTRHEKGYEYFPDMAHSRSWESYSEHPTLPQGMTMMTPIEGTIPRGHTPYPYPANAEGREQAARILKNILETNESNLKRGKEQYRIFCQSCHGETGDGEGFLHTSGKYSYKPASLVNEKMRTAADGEFYHAITAGWGLMGAHAAQISPDDRWRIIMFIRNELQSGTVK